MKIFNFNYLFFYSNNSFNKTLRYIMREHFTPIWELGCFFNVDKPWELSKVPNVQGIVQFHLYLVSRSVERVVCFRG